VHVATILRASVDWSHESRTDPNFSGLRVMSLRLIKL
jgi:hypothetical protein